MNKRATSCLGSLPHAIPKPEGWQMFLGCPRQMQMSSSGVTIKLQMPHPPSKTYKWLYSFQFKNLHVCEQIILYADKYGKKYWQSLLDIGLKTYLIDTNNFVPLKDASIVVFACLPSLNYCLIVVFVMADHTDLIVSLSANLWRYHAGDRGEQQLSGFGDCLKNKYIQISDSMYNFHGFTDFKD